MSIHSPGNVARRLKVVVGIVLGGWLAGAVVVCGPTQEHPATDSGAHDATTTVTSIDVTPAQADLVVVDGVGASQAFTATAHLADGSTRDVSAEATWSVDDTALGQLTGATFTAGGAKAGASTVRAAWSGAAGSAVVTVDVQGHRVVDPAPANAPDLFAAATEQAALAPTVVYPPHQTLVPPNLGDFEVHWRDAAGCDLFEVRLQAPHVDLRLYTTGAAMAGTWASFTTAEWSVVGSSLRGEALTVTVRGLASATPGAAGTSSAISVGLADEPIQGGIYYWAAASAQGLPEGIYRHDFERPGEPAEEFYTVTQSPAGRCVACHAMSRAGDRMAVTFDGGDGAASIIDVATRTPTLPTDGTYHFNFATFHPEGTRLVTVYQGTMTLRDPDSGADLGTVPTGGWATQPDWSPAGDALVYVAVDSPGGDWHFGGGHLMTLSYDLSADTFGAPAVLVPAETLNIYYPAWSPDGDWIAFNKSDGDSYDDPAAQLWVVRADGTAPPLLLDRANVAGGLTNSWPRWAPFEQAYSGQGDTQPLLWLTFSSKRDFGVRLVGAAEPQIWMTAFFPTLAAAAQDPSVPPFRLPFQEIDSNNHIAQWTTEVIPVN
jgi:hypothetical protein